MIHHGFANEFARAETAADRGVAVFFVAYCVADLATGAFDYKEQIDWQSGWAHHTFYAMGISVMLWRGHTKFFTAGLLEEIPTTYVKPSGNSSDASRRRRGCHVDRPRRRVAATPRVPRGSSGADERARACALEGKVDG